ncbi:MAG TPA: hypothetical protein VMW52_01120 [Phycisphaerae bacterium]|nr:hypothetical protein [Phycisphaerae bacterium]
MPEIQLSVRYDGPVPGSVHLRARTWRVLQKASWEAVGKFWHATMLRKHFTPGGAAEYGYTPRQRGYTESKLEKFGHSNPLEWTGESKRGAAREDVRATFNGVRVVLHAPKLNFRGKDSNVRMSEEMRTISTAEGKTLSNKFDAWLERRLKQITKTTTQQIK